MRMGKPNAVAISNCVPYKFRKFFSRTQRILKELSVNTDPDYLRVQC